VKPGNASAPYMAALNSIAKYYDVTQIADMNYEYSEILAAINIASENQLDSFAELVTQYDFSKDDRLIDARSRLYTSGHTLSSLNTIFSICLGIFSWYIWRD
jgi:hypothetical protein